MSVILAIVGGLLLLVFLAVISMRLTDRKSTDELKRQIPDASSSNSGGYNIPGDPL